MSKYLNHIALTGILLFMNSCSMFTAITGSEKDKKEEKMTWSENLRILREPLPEKESIDEEEKTAFEGYKYDVTDSVNFVLDSIAILKKYRNSYTGYAIQLYSSSNYEDAKKTMGKALREFGEYNPVLNFQQPNFKVKIGKFNHELHAQGFLTNVKNYFPNAIIVPEKYPILEMEK